MSAQEAMEKILRCKAYFGRDGGVTVSGGEALLQPEFVTELFTLCHSHGIHTALDTSGCILSEPVLRLLDVCDLCLLDIKACSEDAYRKLCGGSLKQTLRFLQTLDEKKIPTWVRQVIVPGYNDTPENIKNLKALAKPFGCIEKIELLPFRKLCVTKYEQLGVPFPLAEKPEATEEAVARLQAMLTP